MSGPTAQDLEHLPSLDFALSKVTEADPDGVTIHRFLYRSVSAVLQDAGRLTIPQGSFNRLMSAAGFPRKSWRNGARGKTTYFEGLNLLDDAP
ncbi:hypothetical protein ACFVJK_36820 [Streptomyces sp. NPDC127172]|uniref:hypothetical protein n=1 Tax=Streptomyces sp. NPDC127172 TaxID=3345382 RepID=UPI003626446F